LEEMMKEEGNNVKNQEQLHQYIDKISKELTKLCSPSESLSQRDNTYSFMMNLLHTYCLLKLNPPLNEEKELQDFLQESAIGVACISYPLIKFQADIEPLFTLDPDYDPWLEVCTRRSALEVLRELYQDTQHTSLRESLASSDPNEVFNPEDVDELIEAWAISEPVSNDNIPAGIPRSHWWWWGEKAEDNLAA
jgi:hypothetical protein